MLKELSGTISLAAKLRKENKFYFQLHAMIRRQAAQNKDLTAR